MKLSILQQDLGSARRMSALLLMLLAISIAANLVLSILAARASGRERIVVVPPTIHKTFWLDEARVSREYLEQMGYFLMQLVLNVTPQSVEHQSRVLLQYASPAAFGELRAQLAANTERLKRDGAATVFSPQDLSVDAHALKVGVRGNLTTFISDRRVAEAMKAYVIEFQYTGGRVLLKTFRETQADDPLETKRAPRPAAAGL
jgi:conjugal transfer pilus assembly protein TraE